MRDRSIKPTVAIVAPYFPPQGGGLERYAYEVSSRLSNLHNYNVIVITSAMKGHSDSVVKENGMTVYRLSYSFKISNTPFSFKWFLKINKILKSERPDIINIHMPVPGIGDVVSMLSGRIPTVVTYHAGSMRKEKSKLNCLVSIYESFFLPIVLNKSKHIISSSECVRTGFLKDYVYKSTTVTPAVDSEFFKPDFSKKTESPSILFVAGLNRSEQYKGLGSLIDAMVEVVKFFPEARLIVVGDGDMKGEYMRKVKTLGVENSVTFRGRLFGDSLISEYQKAHVFVHPSSNESFSMVILEAMASALPVVAINVGGTADMVSSENGFLLDSNNSDSMALRIMELLKDVEFAKKLGLAGRSKAEEVFNWETRLKQYNNIFENSIVEKNNINTVLRNSNKIAIIGGSASGKTTLSRQIASDTGLPLFHTDQLIWSGKWEAVPEQAYVTKHQEILDKESWIIEGHIDSEMVDRLKAADMIIYLDYSRFVCVWRFVKRWFKYRNKNREELPSESLEKFNFVLFLRVLFRRERLHIEKLLKINNIENVVRIDSPHSLERCLSGDLEMQVLGQDWAPAGNR